MPTPINTLLADVSLIPVAVIVDEQKAVPLAQALRDGGIKTIEVTLRTSTALKAIEQIAQQVPDLIIGAGSVVDSRQLRAAAEAGAQYAVSPGYTQALLEMDVLPYLPGASTAAEVMQLRDNGYFLQKFFPAENMGGLATLSALHPPIPDVSFCPTGGINRTLARAYLAEDFVFAVGGSWFIDSAALERGDFAKVSLIAEQALDFVSNTNA